MLLVMRDESPSRRKEPWECDQRDAEWSRHLLTGLLRDVTARALFATCNIPFPSDSTDIHLLTADEFSMTRLSQAPESVSSLIVSLSHVAIIAISLNEHHLSRLFPP
jgi:hypothetical protein